MKKLFIATTILSLVTGACGSDPESDIKNTYHVMKSYHAGGTSGGSTYLDKFDHDTILTSTHPKARRHADQTLRIDGNKPRFEDTKFHSKTPFDYLKDHPVKASFNVSENSKELAKRGVPSNKQKFKLDAYIYADMRRWSCVGNCQRNKAKYYYELWVNGNKVKSYTYKKGTYGALNKKIHLEYVHTGKIDKVEVRFAGSNEYLLYLNNNKHYTEEWIVIHQMQLFLSYKRP